MSAPKSLSSIEQYGPAKMRDRSTTRMPSRGFTLSRLTMHACRRKCFPLQATLGMKIYPIVTLATLLAFSAHAEGGPTNQDARAILGRVLANRPPKDFS